MSTNASPTPSPPDLDLERIRELLASRHGIVVSADDPILTAVALNDVVLDNHAQRVERMLQQHARRLAEADDTRLAKHRDLAKAVLGDALRQAKNELNGQSTAIPQHRGAGASPAPAHDSQPWRTIAFLAFIAALVGWSAFLMTALR